MSFQGSLFDDELEPAPKVPASAVASPADPAEAPEETGAGAVVVPDLAVGTVSTAPVEAPIGGGTEASEPPPPEEPPPPVREPPDEEPIPLEAPPEDPPVPVGDPREESPPARAAMAERLPAAPPEPASSPGVVAVAGVLTPEEKAVKLAEVRATALGCTRCGLSRTRTHVVFGEGNPNAPLVFVGEGPGENEDATGRPFVGRAGKLLDEVLRRNGMTREHVYIANVVKCRAADMVSGRYQNRPPGPDEIGACQDWLEEQFRIIKPLVIVCVGAPSANTIIHKGFRITSERGKWFTNSTYAPWAMAVFHPAYVLRLDGPAYGAALETLVEDVASARRKVIEVKRQLKEAAAAAPPPRTLFD